MLLRKVGKYRVATLKRTPSAKEFQNFDISEYPRTFSELFSRPWKDLMSHQLKLEDSYKNNVGSMIEFAGEASKKTLHELNRVIV